MKLFVIAAAALALAAALPAQAGEESLPRSTPVSPAT